MAQQFSDLGKIEAIAKLYEGTPYKAFEPCRYESSGKSYVCEYTSLMLEGIDFDLTYFPLKHLGYKGVIAATSQIYAAMGHPATLSVTLGISAKLDFSHIKELWDGVVSAAREHGYGKVALDLVPSRNGLCIAVSAVGETSLLTEKRRPKAKSMDLICVTDNLGAAYFGQMILEKEKRNFEKTGQQSDLSKYRQLLGAYLKPELNPTLVGELEKAEIIPSFGYVVKNGLSDAVLRLVRDSGLGAKVYAERIPFAGHSFDLAKEMNIDAMSAAMNGGDDFRLLYTIPIGSHDRFRHDFQTCDIIGHLAKPEVGAVVVTPDGVELPLKAQGW